MVLPLYLALTAAEISAFSPPQKLCAYMACHFSPYTEGLSNIPDALPTGSLLILNDRIPCTHHSPDLVASQLADAVQKLHCDSVLLDFQRPSQPESITMVRRITQALPCPAAVTEGFAADIACPVFLSPPPLHKALSDHLCPWLGREIWLEAALCQERITITNEGSTFTSIFPTQQLEGGFYNAQLRCRYHTAVSGDGITFTLFDTPDTLTQKLELACALGVTRAVGLFQELGSAFG